MRAEGRLTRYRKVVLDTLRSRKDHPTAAEVFRFVRRRRPGVAYATIYNSLNWLEQKGLICRLVFGEQIARYDPIIERHDHLVCGRCGSLRDVWLKLPAKMLHQAARGEGFRIERHRTELFGLCGDCARAVQSSQ